MTTSRKDPHTQVWRRASATALALCLILGGLTALQAEEPVLEFSGSDSYIDLGMPEALQMAGDAPFTIEGWIYLKALSSRDMLYSKTNARSGSPFDYMLGFIDGKMTAYDGGNWRYPSPSGDPIETHNWYHVAFSFDGTGMDFFLDGNLLGRYAGWGFSNDPENSVKLGGYSGSAGDINGMKHDVRVWDHARNENEIQYLMYRRLTGEETGLLGYWPLDEGSGEHVFDATVNAATGLIVNATWITGTDLNLEPAPAGFVYSLPLTLADIQTGSTEFTNSNEVDLVEFPVPENYTEFQFTLSGDASAVDPDGWNPTNAIPGRITFAPPAADTNISIYAWFTNTADTVSLMRATGEIVYHKNTADVTARAKALTTLVFPGAPARISVAMIDDGSSSSIGIFAYTVYAAADETPEEEGIITLSDPGDYTVTLSVMDMAGNTDSTTTVVTLGDGTAPTPATLWEIPRDQMEARGTGTYRENVPARVLSEPSFWRTDFALPQALIFNLRDRYPVAAFSIYSTALRPKGYALYLTDTYSTASGDWGEPVAVGQLPDASDWHTVVFPPTEGNFMVLQFTERHSTRIQINEVKVFAYRPFTLASPVTGNTHYSNTNTMDVVKFPVLEGYDFYQVASTNEAPGSADPNWLAYDTNSLPASVTFEAPDPEGEVTLYAWFRDSTDALSPVGFPTTFSYVRDTADVQAVVPNAVTTYAWDASFPAVVQAFDLRPQVPDQHAPYLGADSSSTIGLHALTVSCPQDETPGREERVTLSSPGTYTVTFTATDRAGNRDAVPVSVTVRDMAAHVAGKRFAEDWTAPASPRAWPQAFIGLGPYPPYPPQIDWRVQWPEQWLIDYVSGERVTVDLTVQAGPSGRSEPHQQLYASIENSGALDVDMRSDFQTLTTSGFHNPGLLVRFHPRDWRSETNERRGYLLFMERTGPVYIQRVSGGSHTTLASLAGVVVGGQWMTARFLVEQAGAGRTRLRAKLWLAADPEPDAWTLEVFDETPELQTPGRMGIFGLTSSNRRFSLRNLEAKPLFRGTLIMIR